MEILNNTVIIPCVRSVNSEENSESLTLKVPGKVLYDLYNNGKRCICKIDGKGAYFISEIISSHKEFDDEMTYSFLAKLIIGDNAINCVFIGNNYEEPTFTIEG